MSLRFVIAIFLCHCDSLICHCEYFFIILIIFLLLRFFFVLAIAFVLSRLFFLAALDLLFVDVEVFAVDFLVTAIL